MVQGEETYEVTREGGGLVLKSKFNLPFWGEEAKPSLTATLRTATDLTPERFEIKGVKATEVEIDASVEVRGRVAEVREGGKTRKESVPERFFTLAGYAPVSLEMMLVRYWLGHGLKSPLKILPGGEVTVERRGADTVNAAGKQVSLERYSLGGVAWGRQTLWFDAARQLVAVVNIGGDVETNFYAIRDGYESAMPFFIKRAAEDGLDRLTQVGNEISPRRAGALVLLGATLIDGTGKAPVKDSAVVIEGDRITAAGPRSQVAIPKGATVLDAAGKYILPGLWDMHAHLYQVEFGPAYLAAGITSARDVGNDMEFATTLREAARQGRGLQPRLMLAGYIDGKNDAHSFDVQVDTPEEARAAVRRYKQAGYEQIKIRDHVKPDILKVIADEAHRLGMTLVGHVPKGMDAVQAVEAGMDQISHLNFAATAFETKKDDGASGAEGEKPKQGEQAKGDERQQESGPVGFDYPEARRAFRVFREHGTVLDPTVATLELFVRPKNEPLERIEPGFLKVAPELVPQLENKGLPPETAPQGREAIRQFLSLLGALHRAGVPVVAGTDVSVPAHSLYRELELYVQAGFTPLEAIQATTLVPARVMKLDKEVGTVEAGKRADLIVLDANPLENISNIRTVRLVVAQGRLFDSAKLWQSVGFKP
jgi:imidazolonepropionase-like amidohydrolase